MIKKIRLYFNITWVTVVTVAVLIFLFTNREVVEVKFLGWTLWASPLYVLIFASALLGIVSQIVVRRIWQIVRQLREMKKESNGQKKAQTDAK